MHPVIRIVCLIALALWMASGSVVDVAVGMLMVALAYLIAQRVPQPQVWRMVWRLRMLALALLILYGWMSPVAVGWRPDGAGLWLGVARVAGLVVLVLAVHLINLLTSAAQWLAAIYWLAYPLRWVGLSRDRLAMRMHLVMYYLNDLQDDLARRRAPSQGNIWQDIVARVEAGWQWGDARMAQPVSAYTIEVDAPPVWQWAIPLTILCMMWVR
ncbi:MAG: hypothetical protein AABY83_01215 [Pseudomonadota bacterium]